MFNPNSAILFKSHPANNTDWSNIGSTPIIALEELAAELEIQSILVKDESKNQFGTFKDRRSKSIVKFAKENSFNTIALITAGNAGYSLLKACEGTSISLINVIDKDTSSSIKEKLKSPKSQVLEVDLNQSVFSLEDMLNLANHKNHDGILDASNGFHEAYESIFYEVAHKDADYIVVPFGSGEAFFGIVSAISKTNSKTKVIGIGVKDRLGSCAKKLCCIWTPYENMLEKALEKGHILIRLDDREIAKAYKTSSKFVKCEPSSSVIFGVFGQIKFNKYSRIILVNSGRGLF